MELKNIESIPVAMAPSIRKEPGVRNPEAP